MELRRGDGLGRWFNRAGGHRDAFRKDAYFASLGWRREWAVAGPLTAGLLPQAGPLDGSGHHGLATRPQLNSGSRPLALELVYSPRISVGTRQQKTAVTTLNLRWTF
ncbi:hypothetical protein [Chromobacterium sphagni]|uniref:Haemolysin activator HlyB C-terminal domain-containing protein n=1 Tax=Chromobacterium sphagni TaxID=1903179 RepID=A0ABX3CAR8_9NEIS|nr:hypothetical protein [Chromobacterium sphagni]OHX19125.1 hypothetical protein BI344_19305 [Chromobacterium sphagni]